MVCSGTSPVYPPSGSPGLSGWASTVRLVLGGKNEPMTWAPVYKLVRRIPRGKVITYGQLARTLRLRGGARTAGRAMAACPSGRGIPWHRVVGAGGRILIREPYASLQRKLLESEGVRIVEMRVSMSRHAWSAAALKKHPAQKRRERRGARRKPRA